MATAELVSGVIVGMAGHVDHGKSALVTALTGRAMDRLAEERRRGITIDLNFAPLELAPGVVAGIVDVPGHEDFLRAMVAGASGVDVALLVVAADEGIMPQTREHLLVLEALRVSAGIAVITKADAVVPEWLELVWADVAEWLARSSVPFVDVVVVSARTGQGVDALRAQLATVAASVPVREEGDLFRMPVDRAFTVAGSGTVVSGTTISGTVAVGDVVRLLPSGHEARVRSIESHGVSLARSTPGARTALALNGVEREQVARGDTLVLASEPCLATMRVDAELTLAREVPAPLIDGSRVRVHHGTAEVMARVRLEMPLEPGGTGVARLALEAPIVARGDDRVVLRSYSPMTVIGGGRILDPLPESRRRKPTGLDSTDAVTRLSALVERRRAGLKLRLLPIVMGLSPAACDALVAQSTRLVAAGDVLVRRAEIDRMAEGLVAQVAAFNRQHPHEAGMSVETLRRSLRVADAVAAAVLGAAEQSGRVVTRAGTVALSSFRRVARASEADQRRLVAAVREAGLAAPSAAELAVRLGVDTAEAGLRQAALLGDVVQVEPGRYVAAEALEGFAVLLREVGASGEVTPAALRDRTGLSRKYLIPLLEWADRQGITHRVGESRRLARGA